MKTVNKFLATLGLVAACWMAASASAYAGVAGHVQFVSGNVQIISPTGQARTAQKGDAVNEGDTLSSAQRSTAQIKMLDGGFFAVRPETRMKFDKFLFSGKVDGSERGFFSLIKGGFRAVSGLIGRVNKQNYKVTTPSATIGIRGTDYEVVVAEEKVNLALAELSWMISQTDAPPPVGLTVFSAVIVNGGMIQMKTNLGEVLLKPGQGMAISYGMDKQPKIVPVDIKLFPGAGNGQNGNKGGSAGKGGDSGENGGGSGGNGEGSGENGGDSGGTGGDSGGTGGDSGGTGGDSGGTGGGSGGTGSGSDGTGSGSGGTGSGSGGAGGTTGGDAGAPAVSSLLSGTNVPVIVQPPPPPTACVGATCVNLNLPTVDYGAQATALATQAGTAATAAATAAAAAAQVGATLANIATVPVSPATAAIFTADTNITTTSPLVTAATALAPANATAVAANASAAQTAAATAAAQAAAAQAALNAHGSFADSTAGPANTTVQSANGTLQTANTAVQGAVATVTAQNAALVAAQGAAGTALTSANTALSTASGLLNEANLQNENISSAQSLAAAQLTPAQTAANAAQAAANAAQAAAVQAASLQAAGDLAGAQAQLAIVQQQLAIALLELGTAQSAQAAVTSQLASAQAAQTAAGAAVTAATTAATGASTAAATADTQAAAAQTAASAATTALNSSTTNLAAVNTQASAVAANAPIAAYNNPAVVTADRFVGMMSTVQPDATSGYIEGYGPGAGFTTGTANTSFVLDGAGNLVESRHAWYEETAASTATPQVVMIDANIKRTGGTVAETFMMPDNSIYAGRWVGGTITVTDNNATPLPTITRNLGLTSEHWAILLAPPVNYVQTLGGTVAYVKVAATSPTDALGNAGTLNTASLTANFTSQLVDAALNLTIANKTLDVVATGMAISGAHFSTGTQATATCAGAGCAGTYYANVGGGFAGDAAATAGVNYTLWTGATPGATTGATDLIQGLAAFSAGTLPTVPTSPYVATNNAVAYTGSYGGSFSFIAAPADSGPTVFGDAYSYGSGFRSDTLIGATGAMAGGTWNIPNSTQQITYGGWGSISSISSSEQFVIMPNMGGNTLPSYMYGAQGYLDANYWNYLSQTAMGAMAATFSYTQVAATSFNSDTWTSGSVSSATMSANFTAQTVTVALAGTMGANNWALNSGTMPITMPNPNAMNAAGARFVSIAPTVTMNGGACATCGGNLEGAFVGQNYAGAIVSYGVWDNSPILGMNAEGMVGFARQGAVTDGTAAPTGVTVVADAWQIQDSTNPVTVDGSGVLTGWSGSGYSATVSPATGSVAQTAVGSGSGTINWGTWAEGSIATSTFSYVPGTGQFHWITAPEPTPIYLAEVLTTTVPYSLQGGAVTSLAGGGVAGTVSGTTALTANFATQSVAVNVALAVNGHNWVASTPDAPLYFLSNNSMTGFSADSRRLSWESGYLTVTVDGVAANGSLAGQLVGEALGGAILKFNLDGQGATGGYDFVQGVAALAASTPNDPATSYRMIAVAMNDPTALAPTVMIGGSYNNAARVVTDVSGNLTQFDMNSQGGGNKGGGVTVQHVSGTFVDQGSAVIGGSTISWGRWAPGTVVALTDRVTGVSQNITLPSGSHAVLGPLMTGPVALPMVGVYGYTVVGNTTPTTDTGVAGTFNSASLQANFSTQTVNVGVNVTAAGATLGAAATNIAIQNRATFFASSMTPGMSVTCTGTTCGTTNQAAIGGAFGGPGGMGAAITYGFQKQGVNAGTVSGVAVFQQGAAIPQ